MLGRKRRARGVAPLEAKRNERRGLCNMSQPGGQISLIATIEGWAVIVIDNTGPMVSVMMRVEAGQILEDAGACGGGDVIKIRLINGGMEREDLESQSCRASLLHACAPYPRSAAPPTYTSAVT